MKNLIKSLVVATVALTSGITHAQVQISPEYMRIIQEANILFLNEDYDAVLTKLDAADTIQIDTPIAINMRGAVLTEQKKWDDAKLMYEKALEVTPEFFAPRFNLGEILFLQEDYAAAGAHFTEMLKDFPKHELLLFKICLTYLMQDDMDSAIVWRDKIKFPSDTPAYYFAFSAIDFRNGKEADAKRWIASSESIFSASKNLIFLQSFADLGWIKRDDYIHPINPSTVEAARAVQAESTSGTATAK